MTPPPVIDENSAEYASWKRLHLSKCKLDNVAEMAGLMAGFAVVATVELQINDDANISLLIAFAVTTSLLVATCMAAVIISRCVVPHLESVAETANFSEANQSPHDKMIRLIDISWILTNSVSLFLFSLEIVLMCWIKYTIFSKGASIAATVIMAPVLVIIVVFGMLFYRKIIKHQYIISTKKFDELEELHRQLELVSSLPSAIAMSYQGHPTTSDQQLAHYSRQEAQQHPPQYLRTHSRPHFYIPSGSQSPSPQTPRTPRHIYQVPPTTRYIQRQHRSNPNLTSQSGAGGGGTASDQIFFGRNFESDVEPRRTRMAAHGSAHNSTSLTMSPTWSTDNDSVFIA